MNSRDRIRHIIAREPADTVGLWLGNPHVDLWPDLNAYFGTNGDEELRLKLDDDVRWITPHHIPGFYNHPEGRKPFDLGFEKTHHGQAGPFANTTDPKEVEDYEWPDVAYLNEEVTLDALRNAGDYYRASGYWTCFYHDIIDLFGMTEYLMKMYTHPEVVHAVTDRVCEYYYKANEALYKAASDEIDGFFFGNDFGTQQNLICGPKQFDEFIMPWFRQFTELAHRYDHQVILHSCGSIYKVIERLIEAEVDCIHPLQALAKDMDAATLARDFKGRITFMGGIDAQRVLPFGTPQEVREDVHRVRKLLGPHFIVSPSHEKVMPDVPPANLEALALAARETI
jgi:uroporphyrinogen decarboxylase